MTKFDPTRFTIPVTIDSREGVVEFRNGRRTTVKLKYPLRLHEKQFHEVWAYAYKEITGILLAEAYEKLGLKVARQHSAHTPVLAQDATFTVVMVMESGEEISYTAIVSIKGKKGNIANITFERKPENEYWEILFLGSLMSHLWRIHQLRLSSLGMDDDWYNLDYLN